MATLALLGPLSTELSPSKRAGPKGRETEKEKANGLAAAFCLPPHAYTYVSMCNTYVLGPHTEKETTYERTKIGLLSRL